MNLAARSNICNVLVYSCDNFKNQVLIERKLEKIIMKVKKLKIKKYLKNQSGAKVFLGVFLFKCAQNWL